MVVIKKRALLSVLSVYIGYIFFGFFNKLDIKYLDSLNLS